MRLYRHIDDLTGPSRPTRRVAAIGVFDGLHIGHARILRTLLGRARDIGEPAIVCTFEPMPAEFFATGNPPPRLTCFRERFELVAAAGVDELFCPRFESLRALAPEEYIETLLARRLGVTHIVVGRDFRFGDRRRGTLAQLEAAGREHGFGLTVVDDVHVDGERVSSTAIREALQQGRLDRAEALLGRAYSMSGRVVRGRGLGRELGFPTANVNIKRRTAPVDGIFAVRVHGLGAVPRDGVASVGSRPTIGGGAILLEVFVFDFDADVYGSYIRVEFIQRLREERHFDSLEAMQTQMHLDVEAARAALAA